MLNGLTISIGHVGLIIWIATSGGIFSSGKMLNLAVKKFADIV